VGRAAKPPPCSTQKTRKRVEVDAVTMEFINFVTFTFAWFSAPATAGRKSRKYVDDMKGLGKQSMRNPTLPAIFFAWLSVSRR